MMIQESKPSILLIYTGGTIGMIKDYETGVLKAFNFKKLLKNIPELQLLDCKIDTISFEEPIDSSNIQIENWQLSLILSNILILSQPSEAPGLGSFDYEKDNLLNKKPSNCPCYEKDPTFETKKAPARNTAGTSTKVWSKKLFNKGPHPLFK